MNADTVTFLASAPATRLGTQPCQPCWTSERSRPGCSSRLAPARLAGFTIVELMVAMVLGLILLGVVVSAYISSGQATRLNQNLTGMHEDVRVAMELLARDIREAGSIACGNNLPVANVLNGASSLWWANWSDTNGSGNRLRGYAVDDGTFPKPFGSGETDRVSGTEALILQSGTLQDGLGIVKHNPTSAEFTVNTHAHGFKDGDIAIVCDYKQAAIFQISSANSSNVTIVHNTGGSQSPGNCSKGLGFPTLCTTNGRSHTFAQGGFLAKFTASGWYIGRNGRGTTSLYRLALNKGSVSAEEIAESVTNLRLDYLLPGANAFVPASSVTDWREVVAVRVTLTFETAEKVGSEMQKITRTWPSVIALRNRLS